MEEVKLDCTALIKTFNRPPVLFHLLKSIHTHYPNLPIIVVDDSTEDKKSNKQKSLRKV